MAAEVPGPGIKLALLSLLIVALLGTLLRYKIAFYFPLLEQKHLLFAHYHFAFLGWLSHAFYTGFYYRMVPFLTLQKQKIYRLFITLNLFTAFGMMCAFIIQGYGVWAIVFILLSVGVAIGYTVCFFTDARRWPDIALPKWWAGTALLLNIISAAGPLVLSWCILKRDISQELYLGSVYYYLHFQYNGWFFFGAMALGLAALQKPVPHQKAIYRIMVITVVPAFLLSLLWAKLPDGLYALVVLAAVMQLAGWIWFLTSICKVAKPWKVGAGNTMGRIFFYVALLCLTIKFVLQAISAIPSLSHLVFGLRPVVIAYLHLIFLGVYTTFFMGYYFITGLLKDVRLSVRAAWVFLAGVALNELLLAIQGFAALGNVFIPFINEMLFGVACVLLAGAVLLFVSTFKSSKKQAAEKTES